MRATWLIRWLVNGPGFARHPLLCGLTLCAWTGLNAQCSESNTNLNASNLEILGSVAAPTVSPATQDLTDREIKAAIEQMRQVGNDLRGFGTWRFVEISDDPEIALTNIIYEWRGPEGQRLLRKEINERTKVPKSKPRTAVHHLHLNNKEGYWALWSNIAIHYPDPPDGRRRTAKEDPEDPQPVASIGVSVDFDLYDSTMFTLTGKHTQSDARARVLILAEPKENARAFMEAEFKRKMPLLFRPFLTSSKVKEVVTVLIPARVETVIDEETGAFISRRYFAKDGSLMMEQRGWERCDDLLPDAYALPSGVKRVYPKSDKEARHLESKARAEEEKSAK